MTRCLTLRKNLRPGKGDVVLSGVGYWDRKEGTPKAETAGGVNSAGGVDGLLASSGLLVGPIYLHLPSLRDTREGIPVSGAGLDGRAPGELRTLQPRLCPHYSIGAGSGRLTSIPRGLQESFQTPEGWKEVAYTPKHQYGDHPRHPQKATSLVRCLVPGPLSRGQNPTHLCSLS